MAAGSLPVKHYYHRNTLSGQLIQVTPLCVCLDGISILNYHSLSYAGITDLFKVCSELVGVAHKWKKVGLALRLDPNLLDQIEAKKNEVEENLSDTLKEWLKKSYNTESYGDPSWKLLVDAVAHPVGGKDRALALQIAAKYNGKCVC